MPSFLFFLQAVNNFLYYRYFWSFTNFSENLVSVLKKFDLDFYELEISIYFPLFIILNQLVDQKRNSHDMSLSKGSL